MRNPIFVSKKILYALKYRGEPPNKITGAALLSSIGIDPILENIGYGSLLIQSFCKEAFSRNASAVYLTTDKNVNDRVNRFYVKNGFKLESSFVKTNGRVMNRYIRFSNEKTV